MRYVLSALTLLLVACGSDTKPSGSSVVDAGGSGQGTLRFAELGPVPPLPEWQDDPATEEKAELGRALFHDARLSRTGNTHCSSCHVYLTWFQDNLPLAVPDRSFPSDSPKTERHTTSLLNLVYAPVFRWDGSHDDLFDVLAFPFSEANMDLGVDVPSAQIALKTKLTEELPGYVARFEEAFGEDIRTLDAQQTWRLAGRALAHFLRRAVSKNSAFDRYNAGDDAALNAEEISGLTLFRGKARCVTCHAGPFFSDFDFHNISSAAPDAQGMRKDEGRGHITGRASDAGKFLTPTLRNCYDTAPYFHDGSMPGLRSVIEHFTSKAATTDPNHDPLADQASELSDVEVKALIAFLRSLRGEMIPFDKLAPPASFP